MQKDGDESDPITSVLRYTLDWRCRSRDGLDTSGAHSWFGQNLTASRARGVHRTHLQSPCTLGRGPPAAAWSLPGLPAWLRTDAPDLQQHLPGTRARTVYLFAGSYKAENDQPQIGTGNYFRPFSNDPSPKHVGIRILGSRRGALKVIDVDHASGDALFPAAHGRCRAWFIDFRDIVDGWDPDQTMTLPTLETVGGRLRVETSVPGYAMVPNFPALASAGSLRIGPHGALPNSPAYPMKVTVPRISFPRLAHVEFQMVLSFLQPVELVDSPRQCIPRSLATRKGWSGYRPMLRDDDDCPSVDFPALQTLGGRGTWPQSASQRQSPKAWFILRGSSLQLAKRTGYPMHLQTLGATVPFSSAQMRTRPSTTVWGACCCLTCGTQPASRSRRCAGPTTPYTSTMQMNSSASPFLR